MNQGRGRGRFRNQRGSGRVKKQYGQSRGRGGSGRGRGRGENGRGRGRAKNLRGRDRGRARRGSVKNSRGRGHVEQTPRRGRGRGRRRDRGAHDLSRGCIGRSQYQRALNRNQHFPSENFEDAFRVSRGTFSQRYIFPDGLDEHLLGYANFDIRYYPGLIELNPCLLAVQRYIYSSNVSKRVLKHYVIEGVCSRFLPVDIEYFLMWIEVTSTAYLDNMDDVHDVQSIWDMSLEFNQDPISPMTLKNEAKRAIENFVTPAKIWWRASPQTMKQILTIASERELATQAQINKVLNYLEDFEEIFSAFVSK